MKKQETDVLNKTYFSDREAMEAMFSVTLNYKRFHIYSFIDGSRVNIEDSPTKLLGTEYVLLRNKGTYRWKEVGERICGACGEETRLEPKAEMRTYRPYSKELGREIEVTVLCESVWCPLCTRGYFVGNQQDELADRIDEAVREEVTRIKTEEKPTRELTLEEQRVIIEVLEKAQETSKELYESTKVNPEILKLRVTI